MTTFKWVMSEQYNKWYFIEYSDSNNFSGWKEDFGELKFFVGDKYTGFLKNQNKYYTDVKIVKNSIVDKDQWKRFLTKQRREFPRKMIEMIFGEKV